MTTHKINSYSHSDFLNEKRQDPITGDLIVEGDEIVFCNECKSAFLKSSWEYLNENHCNQNKTLSLFPVKKILNLKSKRQYFKAHLHSISDWKQFELQLKTLPWEISRLDMKEFKEKPTHSLACLGIFISSLLLLPILSYVFSFIDNSYLTLSLFIPGIALIGVFLSEGLKMVDKLKKPIISIEQDQIIVFMPYKEQKVTLAKHKIEEIELIAKGGNNYKLQISFKEEILFFSMNLNEDMLNNLIKTLTGWSDTVKIDLSNYNNFKIKLPNNPKNPLAAL